MQRTSLHIISYSNSAYLLHIVAWVKIVLDDLLKCWFFELKMLTTHSNIVFYTLGVRQNVSSCRIYSLYMYIELDMGPKDYLFNIIWPEFGPWNATKHVRIVYVCILCMYSLYSFCVFILCIHPMYSFYEFILFTLCIQSMYSLYVFILCVRSYVFI